MKIRQYKYKISELKSIELNKNISFPLLNIKSLCYFINYKTFKINGLYLALLPTKIINLKVLKNHLLKMVSYYTQHNKETYEREHIKFIKDFPQLYEQLKTLLNSDKTDNTSDILKDYDKIDNYILQIKDSIKLIEKSINQHQKDLLNKKKFMEYKINSFDLQQLNKHLLTDNIKTNLYFYLIKLKKINVSQTTRIYLSNSLIQTALKEYSDYDIIKNDFDDLIKTDLISFENRFLNKTI